MTELIRVVNLMQVNESSFKRRCVGFGNRYLASYKKLSLIYTSMGC